MTAAVKPFKPKSNRGGARPGAGRPKGAKDPATRQAGATLSELARAHTDDALKTLADVAKNGSSESARVAAATALLDRGYGRPPQAVEISGTNGGPVQTMDLSKMTPEQLAALETVSKLVHGEAAV